MNFGNTLILEKELGVEGATSSVVEKNIRVEGTRECGQRLPDLEQ